MIRTDVTNDKNVWFERESNDADASMSLCVKVSDRNWTTGPMSNHELIVMCVHLQGAVVKRTGKLPLLREPHVLEAWEKQLVDSKGKIEEYRARSGSPNPRDEKMRKLEVVLDKAEGFVLGREVGFGEEEAFAELQKAVDAYRKGDGE